MTRADRNNSPAAFTVDIAREAGLVLGTDYVDGDPFPPPSSLVTAKLLGDPIATTIRVFDSIGFFTRTGTPRWTYMAIPPEVYATFTEDQKRLLVKAAYRNEGGTALLPLFALP